MTVLAAKSKYTVPQVVSEGSRHLQLLLALGHSKPSMMPHTVSVSSLLHTRYSPSLAATKHCLVLFAKTLVPNWVRKLKLGVPVSFDAIQLATGTGHQVTREPQS